MRPFGEPGATVGALDAEAAGLLLSAATDITLILDGSGVIRDLSTSIDEIGNEAYADWVGRAWLEVVTGESRPKVESLLADAKSARPPLRWRHVN